MRSVAGLTLAILLLGGTAAEAAASETQAGTLHVLFVGNSYTSTNDLPSMVSALAAAAGHPPAIETARSILPGATLEVLWSQGDARNAIRSHHWDVVVLQEQSVRPITEPGPMAAAVHQFDVDIRENGARTLLFLTWARHDYPATQEAINRSYGTLGRDLGAEVAAVGPVWQRALAADPHLPLYQGDGSHPTPTGSYLAACVIYSALTHSTASCPEPALPGVSAHDQQEIAAVELRSRNWRFEGH